MSSSARPAPAPAETAAGFRSPSAAEEPLAAMPFPYPEVSVPAGSPFSLTQFPLTPRMAGTSPSGAANAEREAQAREAGRLQGELQARAQLEEQFHRERSAIAQAIRDFAGERAAYYRKIEEEAVRLALNIARKVLHREAQIDPLLLMGVVRVALDRIEGATAVELAVHPQQAALWRSYLGTQLPAGELPQVIEDATLASGQCQLRTAMGSADLGLELQLQEIEKGLTDLLAARPGAKS